MPIDHPSGDRNGSFTQPKPFVHILSLSTPFIFVNASLIMAFHLFSSSKTNKRQVVEHFFVLLV
jgi:hypothetical protein